MLIATLPKSRFRYDVLLLWLAMHGLLIVSLLTYHISFDPVVAGRYSIGFVLAVFGAGLWAIGAAALVIALSRFSDERFCRILGLFGVWREQTTFRIAVIVLASLFMASYWLRFPDILPDVPHPYLRFCLSISILAAVYFGLFWRAPDPPARWRWWLLIGTLGALIAVVVTVKYMGVFPQIDTLDELHNYIVQWTYAHTGLLGETVFREMIPMPQSIYDLSHAAVGLLMRLIGDTFWQGRFARMLLSLIALPFIYNCGKLLYGRRAGLFAVVIGLVYLAQTGYARPDVMVGVLLSIGLYAYLKAEQIDHPIINLTASRLRGERSADLSTPPRYEMERGQGGEVQFSPLLHFIAGLVIANSVEGHLLAYQFGVGIALIYLAHWAQRIGQRKRLFLDGRIVALALGAGMALLIYASVHILPDPKQSLHFLVSYAPSDRTGAEQAAAALSIIERQIEVWLQTSPIESWIMLGALVLTVLRFQRGDRLILTLLVVSEALTVATYGYYRAFYQVHYLPLVALLIGKALADGFDFASGARPAQARTSQLVLASMVLVVSLSVFTDTANTTTDPMRAEFEAIGRQLAATIPASDVVVANEDYFLTMPRMNFYSISIIATPTWFIPTVQGLALWEQLQPDVFVISRQIDNPKYVPLDTIYEYMNSHGFQNVRCYTATGLITAQVWVRTLPPGWSWADGADGVCRPY
ncbi:MAG: glycosyltransferase family 39 protein [Aggregatilineales bacterium]